MTSRQRRDLEADLASALCALEELDPVERIIVGAELNEALLAAQHAVSGARCDAAGELRSSGWTLAEIGEACDMTPQRAMQLSARKTGAVKKKRDRELAAGAEKRPTRVQVRAS